MMFEVGKDYRITTYMNGADSTATYTVEGVEGGLLVLKASWSDDRIIFNTASSVFVSAQEVVIDPKDAAAWNDFVNNAPFETKAS